MLNQARKGKASRVGKAEAAKWRAVKRGRRGGERRGEEEKKEVQTRVTVDRGVMKR